MKTVMRDVTEFHQVAGQAIGERLNASDQFGYTEALPRVLRNILEPLKRQSDTKSLRMRLMFEELLEASEAMIVGDELELADALVDLVYVVAGTAVTYGLPIEQLWTEVQRANMDKFPGGEAVLDEGGKVVKPPGWTPPDVEGALRKGGWTPAEETGE